MALLRVKPTALDVTVANFIARHTNRRAESLARTLTWGADEKLLFGLTVLGWLACRRSNERSRRVADHFLACAIASAILPHVMKRAIDQERPDRLTVAGHWRGVPISGNRWDAFPSGHAVHVGALASAATLLPPRYRAGALVVGGVLVATRVILLAHWLTDVLAGLVIGTAIERSLRQLTQPDAEPKRRDVSRPVRRGAHARSTASVREPLGHTRPRAALR